MPNEVINIIDFLCEQSDADRIISEILYDDDVNFASLIPSPPDLYNRIISDPEGEYTEEPFWYYWCCENWGTKWNAFGSSVRNYRGITILRFKTAWDPPFPFIQALGKKYRILMRHEYYDEAFAFWYVDHWYEGKLIRRTEKSKKECEQALNETYYSSS